MVQWWIDRLRNRQADRAKALRAVQEASRQALRGTMAEYDAFAEPARAARDGLLLGTARSSAGEELVIRLPWGDEYAHWLIQGGTGSGKTTWIASFLRQELEAGRPFGVIDCKGDLFHSAIRWTAALAQSLEPDQRETLRKRVVVVNPFSDALVPLNVCRPLPGCPAETQAYEIALALSRLFDNAMGVHMENLLRALLLLLGEAGLSLAEAPQVLRDELIRGILAGRSTNPAVKEFFLGTYPAIPQVSKDALLSRLQGLLLPENIRLMLGSENLLDLRGVLDRGDSLFVFLGKGPGVPEEQVEVLGSLFIQLLFQAVYARGSGCQRPYLLAMDEFTHLLAAPALARRFETALTTARSYGLSLTFVNHNFAQLPPTLREILLGNCDLMAIFRTSARNAEFFGDFLPEVDPELLARALAEGRQNLPREEVRRRQLEALQRMPDKCAFWYDRRKPHRAIRLRAPDVPPPHEVAGMSAAALEDLIREEGWDIGAAAVPRAQPRAEIEARRRKLQELVRPPIRVAAERSESTEDPPGPKKWRKPKLG
jgi:hypothetical protein